MKCIDIHDNLLHIHDAHFLCGPIHERFEEKPFNSKLEKTVKKKNWYFVSKIVPTYCKKMIEKNFLDIRIIYSNSDGSDQLSKQDILLNFLLESTTDLLHH